MEAMQKKRDKFYRFAFRMPLFVEVHILCAGPCLHVVWSLAYFKPVQWECYIIDWKPRGKPRVTTVQAGCYLIDRSMTYGTCSRQSIFPSELLKLPWQSPLL